MKQEPMERLKIQIPKSIKGKLKALRSTGLSTAGLIRHLLMQYFNHPEQGRKAGKP